jgi:hypothetical protein
MGQTSVNILTRTCDVCDKTVTLTQGSITATQLKDSTGWLVLTKEHAVGENQIMPMAKLVCSDACALVCLNTQMLDLPEEPHVN